MKKQIENSLDIATLVNAFYQKVKIDPQIGHFFTVVVPLDWQIHIPKIFQFWESVLLDKSTYNGNPMLAHIAINKKMPLNKQHFDQWLQLWHQTIDEYFEGQIANDAKQKAAMMANLMLFKISQSNTANFIQ